MYNGLLTTFPKEIRLFIAVFVIILSVGFFTGLLFIKETESTTPAGIEENYLGNEEDEDAEVMKFKKGDREMLTIVHTHIHAAILHVHLHPILLHQIFGCIFLLVAGHCRSSHFHVHLGHLFHHRHFVGPIDGRCGKKRSLP